MPNEQPDEAEERPLEEFRRRARELLMRHHVSGLERRAERLAEADTEEEVREIVSEFTAPILDELAMLEAEFRDRLREDPPEPESGEDL